MNGRNKFLKMVGELPEKARAGLVYNYANNPMSLNVCYWEVEANTKLGKKVLKELGYKK